MTEIFWEGVHFGVSMSAQIFLGALAMNLILVAIKKYT